MNFGVFKVSWLRRGGFPVANTGLPLMSAALQWQVPHQSEKTRPYNWY